MLKKLTNKTLASLSIVLIFIFSGAILYIYHNTYPFGRRTCFVPCTMSALRLYADEHNGWFPDDGKSSVGSFLLLYPKYIGDPKLLAGLSGDRAEVERRLSQGRGFDETVCSWIYFRGFRADDDGKIAILMERREGVAGNGSKCPGHAVGFTYGVHRQISNPEWEQFQKEQERLRASVLTNRARSKAQP
jgi:hypothetical protein